MLGDSFMYEVLWVLVTDLRVWRMIKGLSGLLLTVIV